MSFTRKNIRSLEAIAFPLPVRGRGPAAWVKLSLAVLAILASALIHTKTTILLLGLLGIAMALIWGARPFLLARRTIWPFLLFGVILPLPALFIPTGTSEPVRLWFVMVYLQGLSSAITLFLRVMTALSWAGAVFLTEEPHRILASLPLPGVITDILSMSHRYIALIAGNAWEMFMGKRARDPRGGFRPDIVFLGSRVGLLLVRSTQTGEAVYLAMRARGYPEVPPAKPLPSMKARDMAWLAGSLTAIALAIIMAWWF